MDQMAYKSVTLSQHKKTITQEKCNQRAWRRAHLKESGERVSQNQFFLRYRGTWTLPLARACRKGWGEKGERTDQSPLKHLTQEIAIAELVLGATQGPSSLTPPVKTETMDHKALWASVSDSPWCTNLFLSESKLREAIAVWKTTVHFCDNGSQYNAPGLHQYELNNLFVPQCHCAILGYLDNHQLCQIPKQMNGFH